MKTPFFIIIFLFVSTITFSQDYQALTDEATFKQKISQVSEQAETIACEFTQEKSLSFLDETITTEGQFYFKKENLLRWEYTNPFNYIVVLNNGQLTIKDEGNVNQINLQNNEMFEKMSGIIAQSIQGNVVQDSEEFTHEILENNEFYLVKLSPQIEQIKAYLTGIEVYIDKSDFTVSEVMMREEGGDYTHIRFFNKKINEGIEDAIFEIK